MVDLSVEMGELWASLGAPAPGRTRVIQFVAARRGEGTSTVAREFALFAAKRAGRSVWLIDLDLFASPQHGAIGADPERYGKLGGQVGASPDGSVFFTVQPPQQAPDGKPLADARYIAANQVGNARFWVTRFRSEAMRGRQTVHVLPSGDYWTAMRRYADLIVVDCPSADRSQAALTVTPYMDQSVLVVSSDQPDVRPPGMLRDGLTNAGGRVAGVFFNRAAIDPPGFLKAIMP